MSGLPSAIDVEKFAEVCLISNFLQGHSTTND
jgi:hypothetical protein